MKWIGIAYLLYLAYELWRASPVEASEPRRAGEGVRLLALGVIMPLGNPKAVGFYIALLPVVLDPAELTLAAAMQIGAIVVVIWTGTLFGYALLAARAKAAMTSAKAQRVLNRLSAGAMVGAAGAIAARG